MRDEHSVLIVLLFSFPFLSCSIVLVSEQLGQPDNMGEGDWDTPELPIFSMPRQNFPEPPGLLTPPLLPGAMVPFQWEEVPGRPRPWLAQSPVVTEGVKRCLDLPPRLLSDRQGTTTTVANSKTIMSPTTVLEGPYPYHRKRPTKTWSFGRLGSREKMAFGSSRWAGFRSGEPSHNCKEVETPGGDDHGGASGTSLSEFYCCEREEMNGNTKVKITRAKRRRRSFLSLSRTKSHLWESIYEGIKQVVPWRFPSKNKTREEGQIHLVPPRTRREKKAKYS